MPQISGYQRSQKRFKKASDFIYNGTATLLGLPARSNRKEFAKYILDELTNFEVIRTTKTREQIVTVYDRRPPVITIHQPTMTIEALDIGGTLKRRVFDQIQASASATDPCDRAAGLGNDAPDLLRIGSNTITWRAIDSGPTDDLGNRNETTATQTIIVEDTQAPIMVPPPGQVIEVDPSGPDGSGLVLADVSLGPCLRLLRPAP